MRNGLFAVTVMLWLGSAASIALGDPSTPAPGDQRVISGTVASSSARWAGARIVTESVLIGDDGSRVTVHQPGGTVDGIGMREIPGPPLLRAGDRVIAARLARRSDAEWALRAAEVDRAAPPRRAAPTPAATPVPYDLPLLGFVRETTNDSGTQLYWASGCVFMTYDSAGTAELPGDQEFSVMDAALATWSDSTESCAYIRFEHNPPESDLEVGYDRVNLIKFRDTKWCVPATATEPEDCHDTSTAALTTLYFVDDDSSNRDGEILDADIEVNGVNFSVSYQGSSLGSAPCLSDLQNTLTHEAGHILGLGHTCWGGIGEHPVDNDGNPIPSCGQALPDSVTEATMYNYQDCGETSKSTLADDDIAGICAIYPLADDPHECKEVSPSTKGYCAITPGRGVGGQLPALLLLLVLSLAITRRRS